MPPPLPHAAVTQPERTLLACSAAAAVAGLLLLAGLSRVLQPWGCVWKAVTGLPCAGCGGTRAMLLLAGGRWLEALTMNPGAVAAVVLLAGANLYAAAVVLLGRAPWRPGFLGTLPWGRLVLGAIAANWLYLLAAGRA